MAPVGLVLQIFIPQFENNFEASFFVIRVRGVSGLKSLALGKFTETLKTAQNPLEPREKFFRRADLVSQIFFGGSEKNFEAGFSRAKAGDFPSAIELEP
jgi:hypothetical protein